MLVRKHRSRFFSGIFFSTVKENPAHSHTQKNKISFPRYFTKKIPQIPQIKKQRFIDQKIVAAISPRKKSIFKGLMSIKSVC